MEGNELKRSESCTLNQPTMYYCIDSRIFIMEWIQCVEQKFPSQKQVEISTQIGEE